MNRPHRPRVLHVIDSLGLGGAQVVVKGIMEMGGSSNDMTLFSLRECLPHLVINRGEVHVYPSSERFSMKPLKVISRLVAEKEIDILHCHLFRSLVTGWLIKLFFRPHLNLVFHEHGEIFGRDGQGVIEDFCYRSFLRFSKSQVAQYVAVSQAIKESLVFKAKIPSSKIKKMYNFIDLSHFKKPSDAQCQAGRAKWSFAPSDIVIGFIGRLIHAKGWRELVDMCVLMPKDIPFKVLVAGEGEDQHLLEERVQRLGLKDQFVFLGYVSDRVESFYGLVDILVFPSHKEAMGLVALEAYATEVPVIASRIEGLKETVRDGETGLLFEVKQAKDLAEKVIECCRNDGLRAKLIAQAKVDVENYRVEKYQQDLMELYGALPVVVQDNDQI